MKNKNTKISPALLHQVPKGLFEDIVSQIESAKAHVANYTNSALVQLYWRIGDIINNDILKNGRAEYGKQMLRQLAKELSLLYGNGFDFPNLTRMVKFAKIYSQQKIVVTLSQQLSWSHIIRIIVIEDKLKREFYIEMCRYEKWSVRTLRSKIDGMLYERTSISKKPEEIIASDIEKLKSGDHNNPDLYLQDPYILSFLRSKTISSESDFEQAILDELQSFIQELGSDFCFVARQKRMSTQNNDRYLDLLFFHRGMSRLIAIELKMHSFQPEHAGQMEWYLKWLDKNERRSGEEKPLGIIICAGKDQEDIELLELDKTGMHVAEFLTTMPEKDLIEHKLRKAVALAKENYSKRLQE